MIFSGNIQQFKNRGRENRCFGGFQVTGLPGKAHSPKEDSDSHVVKHVFGMIVTATSHVLNVVIYSQIFRLLNHF